MAKTKQTMEEMNELKSNREILLVQFEELLSQAPLTKEEKERVRTIIKEESNANNEAYVHECNCSYCDVRYSNSASNYLLILSSSLYHWTALENNLQRQKKKNYPYALSAIRN